MAPKQKQKRQRRSTCEERNEHFSPAIGPVELMCLGMQIHLNKDTFTFWNSHVFNTSFARFSSLECCCQLSRCEKPKTSCCTHDSNLKVVHTRTAS